MGLFWLQPLFLLVFPPSVAKIQSMKNAVPKNDKKRRKQLTEDITKLEAELNQKHENELGQLHTSAEVKVGYRHSCAVDWDDSLFSVCVISILEVTGNDYYYYCVKVDEVTDDVECMNVCGGEQADLKQTRLSKAQKRRVS